jgi:uncharacterized protein (TIGR02246 family)
MKLGVLHVPALVGLLVVAGCAAPPTTGTAADEAAIRSLTTKYADAWNKGDAAALASLVTDDYEAVNPDGTVDKGRAGAEAREKAAAAQRAGANLTLTVNTTFLKWSGANAAVAGGTWTVDGVASGAGPTKGAWSSFVVKGANGQWKQSTGLVAAFQPPPPPPAPKPTSSPGKKKAASKKGARSR